MQIETASQNTASQSEHTGAGLPGLITAEAGPETRFLSPRTQRLYDWWTSFGPDRLPTRRAFDIVDHADLASRIFLVEVLGPDTYRFRVQGEEVLRVVGRKRTGIVITPDASNPYDGRLCGYYHEIATRRRAMRCVGSARHAFQNYTWFESVDCPLTDEAGAVSHIIGVLEPLSADAIAPELGDLCAR